MARTAQKPLSMIPDCCGTPISRVQSRRSLIQDFFFGERLHAPPPRLQRKHSGRLSSGAADFELCGSKRDSFPNQKARILHLGLTGADPGNPHRFQ